MRPVRITVEGFAAFREPTVVDLADVDLFALVGPTGAGKSSVIDAMVFALYGSVPRYDSENLVHPVITQGALEARVRLDFTAGEDDYVATRVVRRTKSGASTKEARLERVEGAGGTTVLADDAKALTSAVVELLGLDLEQFTKCVVLPQGAFATLLHDTKAKRQDLLVKLLDVGVYERIASAARAEAKELGFRIESLAEQLSRSCHATDDAVRSAARHVEGVEAVVVALDDAAPTLAAFDEELRAVDAEMDGDAQALALLDGVTPPEGVEALVADAAEAAEAAQLAQTAEADASERARAAEEARSQLPAEADLRQSLADHTALRELEDKVTRGRAILAEHAESHPALELAEAEAAAAVARATETLERARVEHAAADLARHLHPGDDCPVCGNAVGDPVVAEAPALADAERAAAEARAAATRAAAALAEHEKRSAELRALLDERVTQRDVVAARLAGVPAADELQRQLDAVADAERRVVEAREADRRARRAAVAARAAADEAQRNVAAARTDFDRTRDRLAVLGPPPAGDDLSTDWKTLLTWADTTRDERRARSEAAGRRRDATLRRRDEQRTRLVERARAGGVEVGAATDLAGLRDACVTEAATARARHAQLVAERDQRAALSAQHDELAERRQVHELLAEQLGARGFEAWLLDEALDALLEGATRWLEQLSSGRYAMAVDDKNQFAVIDHANADERRLAKTLSGGETFLASLALALALAERVGELAASGGRSLEAIFLDEGFGTLDPDTLDVVATAIEELGATGRMVGVISHVRELAERVPVRFEITKAPGTSAVQRVET